MPPMDPGGDERIGYNAGGIFLILLGWLVGVVANVLLHLTAPAGGTAVGPWRVYPTLGPYAWGVLGLGVAAGLIGVTMLWIARQSPKGKFVLPGASY